MNTEHVTLSHAYHVVSEVLLILFSGLILYSRQPLLPNSTTVTQYSSPSICLSLSLSLSLHLFLFLLQYTYLSPILPLQYLFVWHFISYYGGIGEGRRLYPGMNCETVISLPCPKLPLQHHLYCPMLPLQHHLYCPMLPVQHHLSLSQVTGATSSLPVPSYRYNTISPCPKLPVQHHLCPKLPVQHHLCPKLPVQHHLCPKLPVQHHLCPKLPEQHL